MPASLFSRLNTKDFLFGLGRAVRGRSVFSLSLPFSTVSETSLSIPHGADQEEALSVIRILCRPHISSPLSPFVNGSIGGSMLGGKAMAAATHCPLSARVEPGRSNSSDTGIKGGRQLSFVKRVDHHVSTNVGCFRKFSGSLKNGEPQGGNRVVHRYLSSDVTGIGGKLDPFMGPWVKEFHTSCSMPNSAGAAPDMSLNGSSCEEQSDSSAVSSDQKLPGERTLKLLSGSCYLPHPEKEETGGEDAHFICVDEQAIGVADGVGGWAMHGVDAGLYARELMSHSVSAIQEEPKGSIDPSRVLEKAYTSTKAKGSSTACIIALTDQGIHAVNLGDSGFVVVRQGSTLFRSPVQQHDFNFTYQLESGNASDLPSSAQVFTVPVASGDVIIAGTDGLFDNLYNNEVTAVVVHAIRAGLGPQVTAQKIAALARQRALDKNRQTPFSSAAQDAGYRYYGGKLDDITVVVSYITIQSQL
ncbi:putative protein phosphatase 2C 55 [Acorus calamus]|uniref:Protein phosphatase n=1 Tax=Acorus calamus TaxID=4465 RepID=A0AAV9CQ89_ACOCL|nr:putative protein phosphatase 2C 55 [Acorus calamus]